MNEKIWPIVIIVVLIVFAGVSSQLLGYKTLMVLYTAIGMIIIGIGVYSRLYLKGDGYRVNLRHGDMDHTYLAIFGIVFLVAGIYLHNYGIIGISSLLLIFVLVNKDKLEWPKRKQASPTPYSKRATPIMRIGLYVLILLSLLLSYLKSKGII